jgi:hypothetical protein
VLSIIRKKKGKIKTTLHTKRTRCDAALAQPLKGSALHCHMKSPAKAFGHDGMDCATEEPSSFSLKRKEKIENDASEFKLTPQV